MYGHQGFPNQSDETFFNQVLEFPCSAPIFAAGKEWMRWSMKHIEPIEDEE